MRHASFRLLQLSLTCAILLTSAPIARADNTTNHSRFAGVYLSRMLEGSKGRPWLNLDLGRDGTATVTEDPGSGERTLFGHWVDSGSQITVTFDAVEGQPAEPPMVFAAAHDGLQAVTWNHSVWGNVEPPPVKKGYKVKQLYWLTENR